MAYINRNNEIVITWCIDDIIMRAEERDTILDEEQAQRILEKLCKCHDCCVGINWDVIDIVTDGVLGGIL